MDPLVVVGIYIVGPIISFAIGLLTLVHLHRKEYNGK